MRFRDHGWQNGRRLETSDSCTSTTRNRGSLEAGPSDGKPLETHRRCRCGTSGVGNGERRLVGDAKTTDSAPVTDGTTEVRLGVEVASVALRLRRPRSV